MQNKSIPTDKEWGNVHADFDIKSAYAHFSGKSNEDMQIYYRKNALELMELLRFMPLAPFQYYFIGFSEYIESEKFSDLDAPDIIGYFLDIIEYLLENEPEKIRPIINIIMPVIDYAAHHQRIYYAPVDIYGDFRIKYINIKYLLSED